MATLTPESDTHKRKKTTSTYIPPDPPQFKTDPTEHVDKRHDIMPDKDRTLASLVGCSVIINLAAGSSETVNILAVDRTARMMQVVSTTVPPVIHAWIRLEAIKDIIINE